MFAIQEVSDLEMAFPARVKHLMPEPTDIPKEFYEYGETKWNKLFSDWFYFGLESLTLAPKEGIDKDKAIRHIKTIMGSYEPKHEDKTAACSFLFSEWFEDATWVPKKPKF